MRFISNNSTESVNQSHIPLIHHRLRQQWPAGCEYRDTKETLESQQQICKQFNKNLVDYNANRAMLPSLI